jgi:hypothetical protein
MCDCPESFEQYDGLSKREARLAEPDFLSGVQYFYFLRFSLLYLFAVPLPAIADRFTGINSITRGIFASSTWSAFLGEAFFLFCVGVIAPQGFTNPEKSIG